MSPHLQAWPVPSPRAARLPWKPSALGDPRETCLASFSSLFLWVRARHGVAARLDDSEHQARDEWGRRGFDHGRALVSTCRNMRRRGRAWMAVHTMGVRIPRPPSCAVLFGCTRRASARILALELLAAAESPSDPSPPRANVSARAEVRVLTGVIPDPGSRSKLVVDGCQISQVLHRSAGQGTEARDDSGGI